MEDMTTVADITLALNTITNDRLSTHWNQAFSGSNPFIVMKSSNLPGKGIMETPGLVYGDPSRSVKKIGVLMTLTEQVIELAGATGIDVLVAHHPVADAASSGGVLLRTYLDLYGISVFELHEAFHGLHPGMAFIHGHRPYHTEIAWDGVPGKIFSLGEVIEGIQTLGDILDRVRKFAGTEDESVLLQYEREFRCLEDIDETTIAVAAQIVLGQPNDRVKHILHIYPHTGFDAKNLQEAIARYPNIDTVVVSVSRVKKDHELVRVAREAGLNMLLGSSHANEIVENGIPLAMALQWLLPDTEVRIIREKVFSYPLRGMYGPAVEMYGDWICNDYLIKHKGKGNLDDQ